MLYKLKMFLKKSRILRILVSLLKRKPKSLLYRFGKNRFCPVCQKFSIRFDSFGVIPRSDAMCVHCGSLERHRLIYLFLKQKTNFFDVQFKNMLHVAPEDCFKSLFEKLYGENYISADLYRPNVKVKMDITNIQYENEVFDIIYCCHVLEHIPDDRKAMKELFRVLKKGAWAILNVPIGKGITYEDPSITTPKEREKFFGQNDHVRIYGYDYVDRLREAGFFVDIIHAKDFVSPSDIEKFGLSKVEDIYFCTKV